MSALERWAGEVERPVSGLLPFRVPLPVVLIHERRGHHLYHIAQEAVNNAIKHGRRRTSLSDWQVGSRHADHRGRRLGYRGKFGRTSPGMGLHIMNYRARMIGGYSEIVRSRRDGGTAVDRVCFQSRRDVKEHNATEPCGAATSARDGSLSSTTTRSCARDCRCSSTGNRI